MKICKNPPKINRVGICPECSNYICIMKDKETERLHCRCLECLREFPDMESALAFTQSGKSGNPILGDETRDVFASEEEIIAAGWDLPKNKVCICDECLLSGSDYPGHVVIMKNCDTGELFCRCDQCGSIWLSIEDALTLHPLAIAPTLAQRFVRADSCTIPHFCPASRDEIIAAGWDRYDNVLHIENGKMLYGSPEG